MTHTEDVVRMAIAQQAAEWLVSNRSSSLTEDERAGFMRWLKTSPLHVEEYLRLAAVSRDLGVVAADRSLSLELLLSEARQEGVQDSAAVYPLAPRAERTLRPFRTRGWLIGGVAATMIAVLIGVALLWTGARDDFRPDQRYATAHGEQHRWALPDGSTLELNTDSAVRVRWSGVERVVELAQGQAYFQVAKDSQRRFRVAIEGANIVAVGTQFEVYRKDRTALVTVVEGKIAVYKGQAPAPRPGATVDGPALRVRAGEQVSIDATAALAAPIVVNLAQSEAWRRGQIVFEQRPTSEVVAEFNRYAAVPIVIGDSQLRSLPISGAFDARDSRSFIAFLQTLDDVVVKSGPTEIWVLRRTP